MFLIDFIIRISLIIHLLLSILCNILNKIPYFFVIFQIKMEIGDSGFNVVTI